MAAAAASAAAVAGVWPPLPPTERGFGVHLSAHGPSRRLIYGSGMFVVIRHLDDNSQNSIFNVHRAKVTAARFSPNGEWVASCDESGTVLVWGAKNQIVKNTVKAMRKATDIAWDAEGKRIVVCGDGEVRLRAFAWDGGSNLGEFSGHDKVVLAVDYRPTRPFSIVSGGEDFMVAFHTGPPFRFKCTMREHKRFVNCVRFSPDGTRCVSVSSDGRMALISPDDGSLVGLFPEGPDAHTGAIFSASWSADSSRILTASGDRTAKLWNAADRTLIRTFTLGGAVSDQQIGAVFVGETAVTLSLGGQINVLDLENAAAPAAVLYGQSACSSLAVHAGLGVVATTDVAGHVTLYDKDTGRARWVGGQAFRAGVLCSAVTASGSVVVGALDNSLHFTSGRDAEWAAESVALGAQPVALAASSADAGLVAVVSSGKLMLARPSGVVASASLSFTATSVALRPGDAEVAVGGSDRKTHVFAVSGGSLTETGSYPSNGAVQSVAYSPCGGFLVSGCANRTALVRNANDKYADLNDSHMWSFHDSAVRFISWSPSGSRVATVYSDSLVVFTDTKTFAIDNKRFANLVSGGIQGMAFLAEDLVVLAGVHGGLFLVRV